MSYINLNGVLKSENNVFLDFVVCGSEITVSARKDLVIELSYWGYVYSNVTLSAGDVLTLKKGDHRVLVIDYEGKVVKEAIASSVTKFGGEYAIEYQKHNPDEEFVVVPFLYHEEGALEEIWFQIYPNDGKLKPVLTSQTIATCRDGNSRTPLAILLKEAHKKGASALILKRELIELFIPGAGLTPIKKKKSKEVMQQWNQIIGSDESRTNEEVLKEFSVFLY